MMNGNVVDGQAQQPPPPTKNGLSPPTKTVLTALLVMDFDHTIMDVNTDLAVAKLEKQGNIPIEYNKHFRGAWTDYMQAVFELLHQQGVREPDYTAWAGQLAFAPGMERLIRFAGGGGENSQKSNFEIVIVSDANSVFITSILKQRGLFDCVKRVFTNPAHFDETGCLRIAYYHTQTECALSEKNMCKGRIVNEYVEERGRRDGVRFDRVIYVGDGNNDYCPVIRSLGKRDHVFARKGYTLEKLLNRNADKVQCGVHFWSSADEITSFLELLGAAEK